MYLADLRVVRHTEKYLYDFPAIISAVGGSMGLFLGFSFYAMGKNLIDRLLWQLTFISIVLGLSNSGLLITSHELVAHGIKTLWQISRLLLRTRGDPFSMVSLEFGDTVTLLFMLCLPSEIEIKTRTGKRWSKKSQFVAFNLPRRRSQWVNAMWKSRSPNP